MSNSGLSAFDSDAGNKNQPDKRVVPSIAEVRRNEKGQE
jgi:hypothetical protein